MPQHDAHVALLKRHGLKVTAQRLAILEALSACGHHLTADEVSAHVRQTLPSISLTTVYKVLNELVELGEVRRVDLGDGAVRFDPNVDHHAHLVCKVCGRTEDLPSSDYFAGVPAVAARGFEVDDTAVVFFGRCPLCAARTGLAQAK